MAEGESPYQIRVGQRVRVLGRDELGVGEVLRIAESGGIYQADVAFEGPDGRRLETLPVDRLAPEPSHWERLTRADFDRPLDFLLKQLAIQLPLANTGGELSNSRTDLLPHQILLTHDVVKASRRRFLVADEVGLGKTIEMGMVIRELASRDEAERILIICPAGLTRNWQDELRDAFRMRFEVFGLDFKVTSAEAWEYHNRVIASIDTIKRRPHMERLLASPRWDTIIFDEAHHLSRIRYGNKVETTQNYQLADALRNHTRDLFFLSATPHQGKAYQFWSLIQLLDDSLFEDPDAMLDHRGLLNRVMIRRTKREATDSDGKPIFMRRQVQTQTFVLPARERAFYDRLTDYLREGYGIAGLGSAKTTSRQRAVGFVMTTFQKMMSSSPRAIRQALRRRLMVLLAREQISLESHAEGKGPSNKLAAKILRLQDEMRSLAIAVLDFPPSPSQRADADAHIARLKRRMARKYSPPEITHWALDAEEEAEEAIYAEAQIPDEAAKVRELIRVVPEGTDRKFDTLIRALEQIRRQNPDEKFVIFTQYRDTLELLREELGKLYRLSKVAVIKGGPLEPKIAAVEAFWDADGAQFLVSTSAGGEGINLQVGHIVFNYDLPWNPMALEQRIGRLHRYGQTETVQVYNLVAEDTVERRIYALLEDKLLEIAQTIGRIDPATGEVAEDFRSEILGFLGSSPDYQGLYRKALVDRDYRRTEREMADAMEEARKASEALRALAQDLNAFNLEHYRKVASQFTLEDLRLFVEKAVIHFGGAFLPEEDFFWIETPEPLRSYRNVLPSYSSVTFDRKLAMRRRNAQLLGLGHPLVDALIDYSHSPKLKGEVSCLPSQGGSALSVRCLFHLDLDTGERRKIYKEFALDNTGSWLEASPRSDVLRLTSDLTSMGPSVSAMSQRPNSSDLEGLVHSAAAELRAQTEGALAVRSAIVGVALVPLELE